MKVNLIKKLKKIEHITDITILQHMVKKRENDLIIYKAKIENRDADIKKLRSYNVFSTYVETHSFEMLKEAKILEIKIKQRIAYRFGSFMLKSKLRILFLTPLSILPIIFFALQKYFIKRLS